MDNEQFSSRTRNDQTILLFPSCYKASLTIRSYKRITLGIVTAQNALPGAFKVYIKKNIWMNVIPIFLIENRPTIRLLVLFFVHLTKFENIQHLKNRVEILQEPDQMRMSFPCDCLGINLKETMNVKTVQLLPLI